MRALARRALAVLFAASSLVVATRAGAQDYSFEVPSLRMQCFVQPDASVRIVYDIEFISRSGYHDIDIVDIGTPTPNYHGGGVKAWLDGNELTTIRPSEVVTPGFEVHLGAHTLRTGAGGTLRVEFRIPDLVFQDTTRDDLGSLRITPTWFEPRFVVGKGRVELAVHLPEGVVPDEALHHGENFSEKALYEGRAVVLWRWEQPATERHLVGVSFPKKGMQRVVTMTRMELLNKWLESRDDLRVILLVLTGGLFTLLFFRFSAGTGGCLYVPSVGILLSVVLATPALSLFAVPALLGLVYLNERGLKRRRAHYLPALVSVEGGGIKRGLTAPEAAALLELPIGKVLGLVVFGMLRKGLVRQQKGEALQVEVAAEFATAKDLSEEQVAQARRAAAQAKGTVVHAYENPFLDLIAKSPDMPVARIAFAPALKGLVEKVAERLKGFDVEESKAYYRHVVKRALIEAKSIGDIAQRQRFVDDNLDWLMASDETPAILQQPGWNYWPRWHHRSASALPSVGGGGGGAKGDVAFRDVAASFSGWAENNMGKLASAISPGALQLPSLKGGFVDLSGFDKVTGDVFKALAESSSSGGGGGGGGGCACACAGCACACACAGGGR